MTKNITKRKQDHLELCATDQITFKNKTTLLEEVNLIHRATTGLRIEDIDTSSVFAGKKLKVPIWIGSMTGGMKGAADFNRDMARIAGELGMGFCLGSIRPMLEEPSRASDFQVRDLLVDTPLLANISATEIIRRGPTPIIQAMNTLKADGIVIHLNPMMELIQPGGDTDFRGVVNGIVALIEQNKQIPIIVKETGSGLSWQDGETLRSAGVKTVETGGAGGTSWVGVETLRAEGQQERMGRILWDWGIPTAVSTAWMVDLGFQVIASGGIRNGLDVAAALALGAKGVAVAAPLVKARQTGGIEAVREYLEDMIVTLKAVMLGTGTQKYTELTRAPRVIGPTLSRWIETGWQSR